MMAAPKVVLLDEIGAGMNKTLLAELAEDIRRLNRERGITFFLIEHDMELIGRLCDHVVCMAEGGCWWKARQRRCAAIRACWMPISAAAAAAAMMLLLEARGLVAGYGGMDILRGCTITVAPREMVVIVGPNGAGKSTAMKALFGLVRIARGRVIFDGADITNAPPRSLAPRGLAMYRRNRTSSPP